MTVIYIPYRETQSNLSAHNNDSKKIKVGRAGAAYSCPPAPCALGKEPHLHWLTDKQSPFPDHTDLAGDCEGDFYGHSEHQKASIRFWDVLEWPSSDYMQTASLAACPLTDEYFLN